MTPEESNVYDTLKTAGPGSIAISEDGQTLYFVIPFSTGDVLIRVVGEDFRSMTAEQHRRHVQNAILDLMNGK